MSDERELFTSDEPEKAKKYFLAAIKAMADQDFDTLRATDFQLVGEAFTVWLHSLPPDKQEGVRTYLRQIAPAWLHSQDSDQDAL